MMRVGKVFRFTVQRLVDSENQVLATDRSPSRELVAQVVGRPESDDLEQRSPWRIAAMEDCRVREDHVVARAELDTEGPPS